MQTREVDEVLVVDPVGRSVQWHARFGQEFESVEGSRLLDISGAAVADAIDWPPL